MDIDESVSMPTARIMSNIIRLRVATSANPPCLRAARAPEKTGFRPQRTLILREMRRGGVMGLSEGLIPLPGVRSQIVTYFFTTPKTARGTD